MSLLCGVEVVIAVGCIRWLWKRCTYAGSYDSASWPIATADEFEPVPRICRLILAAYEPDLSRPGYTPAGGYRLKDDCIVKRVSYEQTLGNAPPYMIYIDHDNCEIVMAIRGLNLGKGSDYKLMLDNRLREEMFDGGYVHNGLLKSATWVLNKESETLCRLWEENGKNYRMVFAGHSLGSGIAALLTVIVVNSTSELGGIPRSLVRCYAVAPTRCMSLNLALKYADVIYSVVLQDDFLPRTPSPLQDIFKSIFCLPCLLLLVCLRDTFVPESLKLKDPRRLFAPGRMYHIVERKTCRCGRYPPEVRTAIPVDGRFEQIVLSFNAICDHGIRWIEREGEKAVQRLKELEAEKTITTPPMVQILERKQALEKEHKDALEKAVTLNIPHAVMPADEESTGNTEAGSSSQGEGVRSGTESSSRGKSIVEPSQDVTEPPPEEEKPDCQKGKTNWNEVVEKLFSRVEPEILIFKTDVTLRESSSGSLGKQLLKKDDSAVGNEPGSSSTTEG